MLREVAEEHSRVLAETLATQSEAFEEVAAMTETCLRDGGKILIFGNGGSAADAQHFAAELVGRFEHDRQGSAGHGPDRQHVDAHRCCQRLRIRQSVRQTGRGLWRQPGDRGDRYQHQRGIAQRDRRAPALLGIWGARWWA